MGETLFDVKVYKLFEFFIFASINLSISNIFSLHLSGAASILGAINFICTSITQNYLTACSIKKAVLFSEKH